MLSVESNLSGGFIVRTSNFVCFKGCEFESDLLGRLAFSLISYPPRSS